MNRFEARAALTGIASDALTDASRELATARLALSVLGYEDEARFLSLLAVEMFDTAHDLKQAQEEISP